jgi:futalosine hydrolase
MAVLVLAATPFEAAALVPSAPAVRVVVGGIGAANTACALTREFASHPPSLVIQTGIAGAYVPAGLSVGSVVLATEEMYGDVGVITPAGWLPADVIGIPLVDARDGQPARFNQFPCDPDLVARAAAIAGPSLARTGRFLTLAQVTGVASVGDELYRRFTALCESMEGAAAAHVCAIYGIPFLEVRGISNLVEDRNREAWRIHDAAAAAQAVAQRLLDRSSELLPVAAQGA